MEKSSLNLFNNFLKKNHAKIFKLSSSDREKYNKLKVVAKEPEPIDWELPVEIIVSRLADAVEWIKHVYLTEDGKYFSSLNNWESRVMEAALAQEDVIGWLRNEARKPWSFCIPYEYSGAVQPMFPDFLVIRKQDDTLIIDILEPHNTALADSWAKAVGLAKFASKHGDRVGRIELIRVDGSHIKRLDVNDNHNRQKVLAVGNNQHLDQLFASL